MGVGTVDFTAGVDFHSKVRFICRLIDPMTLSSASDSFAFVAFSVYQPHPGT